MPEPSLSRIPITHKTYKNKITNHNNKADLWEKINESFRLSSDSRAGVHKIRKA